MNASVLIPAKGFANAKQRLAPHLCVVEREILAESMLRNVLEQVRAVQGIQATYVVTADSAVTRMARCVGAQVIREQDERGETEAVTFAVAQMKQNGIETVLILPGDLPLLRSRDVESILEQAPRDHATFPFALLVPSRDRMGTNALLLSPPDAITPRFGFDSFCYHLSEASAKRLHLQVLENERVALDIDHLQDLEVFLSSRVGSESCRGLFERYADQ